jgi:hypothetical protein
VCSGHNQVLPASTYSCSKTPFNFRKKHKTHLQIALVSRGPGGSPHRQFDQTVQKGDSFNYSLAVTREIR